MAGGAALDLVGFGEAMLLFQPDTAESFVDVSHVGVHVAGAELNACGAVARLGLAAGLCSRVGADPGGQRVLAHARELGVDTSLVAVDSDYPTGLFLKDAREDGERRVYYYRRGSAASEMDVPDAMRLLGARPRMVLVSGITLALGEAPNRAVNEVVRSARAMGIMVALDPNLRPLLGPLQRQVDAVREVLPFVDVLLLGTDEAGPMFGTTDPAEVWEAAGSYGVPEIVLKAGAEGCYYRNPQGRIEHLPSAATSIVDPVGAGDAFAGGYLTVRLCGGSPSAGAWLGSQLAAAILAERGDTEGLPTQARAHELLAQALSTL